MYILLGGLEVDPNLSSRHVWISMYFDGCKPGFWARSYGIIFWMLNTLCQIILFCLKFPVKNLSWKCCSEISEVTWKLFCQKFLIERLFCSKRTKLVMYSLVLSGSFLHSRPLKTYLNVLFGTLKKYICQNSLKDLKCNPNHSKKNSKM